MISLKVIIHHSWGNTIRVVYPITCESWGFPLWLIGTGTILGSVWVLNTISSNPFRWFFLHPQVDFSYTSAGQPSAEYLRGKVCISLGYSFGAPLSCLCLLYSSPFLILPRFSATFLQCRESPGLYLRSFPVLLLRNSRQCTGAIVGLTTFVSLSQKSLPFVAWYSVSIFDCLIQEGRYNHYHSILARSRSV